MSEQLTLDYARARESLRTPRSRREVEVLSLDNFMPGEGAALARREDPLSSHVAADRAEASGLTRSHCERILAVLREAKPARLTAVQIAQACGLTHVQVARRLRGDLAKRGLVASEVKVEGEPLRWYAL